MLYHGLIQQRAALGILYYIGLFYYNSSERFWLTVDKTLAILEAKDQDSLLGMSTGSMHAAFQNSFLKIKEIQAYIFCNYFNKLTLHLHRNFTHAFVLVAPKNENMVSEGNNEKE